MSADARRAQKAIEVFKDYTVRELLSVYTNLDERADKIADEEFERLGAQPAGEDFDGDMSSMADAALDAGVAFYDTMTGLRQSTLNLFAAGLFHLLEQQLAYLCHDRGLAIAPPADAQLRVVVDWYSKHFALDLRALPEWDLIDQLRLVANAIKHAEGSAAEQLRERRPELFEHPISREFELLEDGDADRFFPPLRLPLAGDGLFVTEEVLNEYITAAASLMDHIARYFDNHANEYFAFE